MKTLPMIQKYKNKIFKNGVIAKVFLLAWVNCFICVAVGQELSLPRPLADLTLPGTYAVVNGVRYSGFAVTGTTQQILVTPLLGRYSGGIAFELSSGTASASGPAEVKEVMVGYVVDAAQNSSSAAVVLSLDGRASGFAQAGVSAQISDASPIPISGELGSVGGAVRRSTNDATVRDAERLLLAVARIDVQMTIQATALNVGENASVARLSLQVISAQQLIAGDYDFDGHVDGSDFLIWQRQSGTDIRFRQPWEELNLDADGNDDSRVDAADFTIWRDNYGAQIGPPGDFDGDGRVDGHDFLKWQRALGTNDPAVDADKNGIVGQGDLSLWRSSFGTGANVQLAASTVSEPSTGLLGLAFAWTLMTKVIASRPKTVL